MNRISLGLLLVIGASLLAGGAGQSQVIPGVGPKIGPGTGFLPKNRPYINLNNNGSLYTIVNPNAAQPSQVPYSFIAVAHEDCRLYNNGAMLMPMHRLQAGECQNGLMNQQQQQNPLLNLPIPLPVIVVNGRPPYFFGTNASRGLDPYNYGSYQPSATSTLSTSSSPSGSAKQGFGGFGTFSSTSLAFGNLMPADAAAPFGGGFEKPQGSSDSDETKK
jgi:hypothetical protein